MAEPPLVAVHIPSESTPPLREDIVNDGSEHQVILPDAMYPTMTVSVLYGPDRENVCIMTGLYSSGGLHRPFPVALTNDDLDLLIETLTTARAQQGKHSCVLCEQNPNWHDMQEPGKDASLGIQGGGAA